MNSIELMLKTYLDRAANGDKPGMSEELIEEFGELCKTELRKSFVEDKEDRKGFTLRPSNLGRPVCQLQMERDGAPKGAAEYTWPLKALYGGVLEAAVMVIMKAAGVNVETNNKLVSYEIGGANIKGTLDAVIDGKVYDIKSASSTSFDSKFAVRGGYNKLKENDDFGYVAQLFFYAFADEKPAGGWIVINKETGDITVCPAHDNDEERAYATKMIEDTIAAIRDKAPFKRCFPPIEEKYRNKATGNKRISTTCSYCSFKDHCWAGDVMRLPMLPSVASEPPMIYYTEVQEKWLKDREQQRAKLLEMVNDEDLLAN